MRHLNQTAIKEHALECSRRYRNGKFKRVSKEFINEVEGEVESIVRKLSTLGSKPQLHESTGVDKGFATGDLINLVKPTSSSARSSATPQRDKPSCE
jgi:hypothetical protein